MKETMPPTGTTNDPSASARAAFVSDETRVHDLPGEFALELGDKLSGVQIAYRTWGTLDAAGENAVVICHALTGSADADRWWARLFGPGRALDPDKLRILNAMFNHEDGHALIRQRP